jgi:fatty-acyl-CoA synthase
MPMTPMFHVHAWGFPWAATLVGVKQVYPGRYDPAFLAKLIATEGVTFTHGVPALLQMLLKAAAAAKTHFGGLKMLVGGSELSTPLAKQALAAGIDVFAGYGMSETGPLVAAAQLMRKDRGGDPGREVDLRVRAGITAPLVDARVVGRDMKELPHDGKTAGELVLRSPWLTQGYVDNPEASEALWAGGYLHTGDIAVVTPDGAIRITDRIKDVIKTGGEWISSLQIEELMEEFPGVNEAAVIGIPDEKWGERPLAFVVAHTDHAGCLHEADIKAHLQAFAARGVISKYGIPDKIQFVDSLAKTSVGKIDKKILRQTYGRVASEPQPA